MPDWTGNKKSTFSTLGASNHSDYERADGDYYATDPRAMVLLLEQESFSNVWECACGGGHLAKVLEEKNLLGKATDLVNRGYGEYGIDFLLETDVWNGDIITNPPYKYAKEFCEHSMEIISDGRKVAMFLKLTFLEGKDRKKFFAKYPPKIVYVSSSRIHVARNGDAEMFKKSSAAAYAWFVWEKGFMGNPIIKWFN